MGSDVGQISPTASLHRDHSISYALVCEKELSHMGKYNFSLHIKSTLLTHLTYGNLLYPPACTFTSIYLLEGHNICRFSKNVDPHTAFNPPIEIRCTLERQTAHA